MRRSRSAFTLVEVLVALLAIAIAVVPLLQSGSSIHRQSYMGELHVLGAIRARALLGLFASMDFDVLHQVLGRAPSPTPQVVNLDNLVIPDEQRLMFSAPDDNYTKKLKLLSHEVTARVIDRHRIQVTVVVRWSLASDKEGKSHEHKASAVLHRPEVTSSLAVKL